MPKTNKESYFINGEKVERSAFLGELSASLRDDPRVVSDYDSYLNSNHGTRGGEPYSEYEKSVNTANYDENLKFYITKHWPDIIKDHGTDDAIAVGGSEFRIERK